mgnify:FL=1
MRVGPTGPLHSSLMGLLAVVWHYWIAPVLVVGALALVLAVIFGYLWQVSRARYPRD